MFTSRTTVKQKGKERESLSINDQIQYEIGYCRNWLLKVHKLKLGHKCVKYVLK